MRRPDRGSVGPLVALLMASLFGFGALAVDFGLMHYQRRALQGAVDAAALGAARAVGAAGAIAADALSRAGFGSAEVTVVTGRAVDDPALPAAARFQPGGEPDAVRVTARTEVTLGLARALLGQASVPVSAAAVAAHRPLAAFTIGSGVAALDGGVANQVLGALLGGSVSLGAVGYDGLLRSEVSLFRFADALATRAGVSAGTYRSLLDSRVTAAQLLDAAVSALADGADPQAATSLALLSQAATGGTSLEVGDVLGLAIHQQRRVGSFTADRSYADLGVNAADLVAAVASLGGSRSAVALPAGINLPGLAQVGVRLLMIEPPQANAPAGLGPVGSKARTAQARVLLSVRLLSLVNGGVVTLPVLLEAAPAEAELRSVTCQGDPAQDVSVVVRARTAVAQARIGQVTTAQFDDGTLPIGTLPDAPILNATLHVLSFPVGVTVRARASATIGLGEGDLTFLAQDMASGVAQSVSAKQVGTTLASSLASTLQLTTSVDLGLVPLPLRNTVNGLLGPLLTTLLGGVTTALQPALAAVDSVGDRVLAAAGLQLGQASVRVSGQRCGVAALVQ